MCVTLKKEEIASIVDTYIRSVDDSIDDTHEFYLEIKHHISNNFNDDYLELSLKEVIDCLNKANDDGKVLSFLCFTCNYDGITFSVERKDEIKRTLTI